ncbi:translation initiation factor IF-2-like [Lacerta agilis]|uniref:translation initiation factor IF-2-like n=1 Tax=Lacerta agilis TaxID=80427 RepID=UPI001419258E|nr:translation initiation factor IF-2-like [Lacerta agilis]
MKKAGAGGRGRLLHSPGVRHVQGVYSRRGWGVWRRAKAAGSPSSRSLPGPELSGGEGPADALRDPGPAPRRQFPRPPRPTNLPFRAQRGQRRPVGGAIRGRRVAGGTGCTSPLPGEEEEESRSKSRICAPHHHAVGGEDIPPGPGTLVAVSALRADGLPGRPDAPPGAGPLPPRPVGEIRGRQPCGRSPPRPLGGRQAQDKQSDWLLHMRRGASLTANQSATDYVGLFFLGMGFT